MATTAKRRGAIRIIILCLILFAVLAAATFYYIAFSPNVRAGGSGDEYLYIRTGAEFPEVIDSLRKHEALKEERSFILLAEQKKYDSNIKPGRYKLTKGMSNNELVNMLRAGRQEPVTITFNSIRLKSDLAARVGNRLECGKEALLAALNSPELSNKYGFSTENFLAMFIPNTYKINWNTSAEDFIARMAREYKNFWSEERKEQAEKIGLSQTEVVILASIVEQETNQVSEKPRVAGVYWNRLQRGQKLEADPTVKFALGDFSIRRLLFTHINDPQANNPYNTYKYKGLPPGPICIPSVSSIDAVLNREKHDYIFFCASPERVGFHDFARTMEEHRANARGYHNKLNKMGL